MKKEFRVWDKLRKRYIVSDMFGSYVYIALGYRGSELCVSKSDLILEQFTGLKDKKGKEIYEGDIIKYTEKMHEHGDEQECIAAVMYDETAASFAMGREEIWNYFFDYGILNIEVIGNIHENTELIK